MGANWSFGRKIRLAFAIVVLLGIGTGVVATVALRHVVAAKDRVLDVNADSLLAAEHFETVAERRISAMRGYLLTREQFYLDGLATARSESEQIVKRLLLERPELQTELIALKGADEAFRLEQDALVAMVSAGAPSDASSRAPSRRGP
jgi:CHASE3 domain sensor protein